MGVGRLFSWGREKPHSYVSGGRGGGVEGGISQCSLHLSV